LAVLFEFEPVGIHRLEDPRASAGRQNERERRRFPFERAHDVGGNRGRNDVERHGLLMFAGLLIRARVEEQVELFGAFAMKGESDFGGQLGNAKCGGKQRAPGSADGIDVATRFLVEVALCFGDRMTDALDEIGECGLDGVFGRRGRKGGTFGRRIGRLGELRRGLGGRGQKTGMALLKITDGGGESLNGAGQFGEALVNGLGVEGFGIDL
jgi:hypothetical protein